MKDYERYTKDMMHAAYCSYNLRLYILYDIIYTTLYNFYVLCTIALVIIQMSYCELLDVLGHREPVLNFGQLFASFGLPESNFHSLFLQCVSIP